MSDKRNPLIREDYVKRPEVLEWVAKHVLLEIPSYKRFTESTASKELKIEQKLVNSPIREFIDENYDNFKQGFIPLKCLYQLYKAWYADTVSDRGKPASKKSFTDELRRVIDEHPEYGWEAPANKRMQTSKYTYFKASSEPLVEQYKKQDGKINNMYWNTKGPDNPLAVPASGLVEGIWVNHSGPSFRLHGPVPPIPPAKLGPNGEWPMSQPPIDFNPEQWEPGEDPNPTYPVKP